MSTYSAARNNAQARGWAVPREGGDMDTSPAWQESWKRYWAACAAHEANPLGGRPVVPHR